MNHEFGDDLPSGSPLAVRAYGQQCIHCGFPEGLVTVRDMATQELFTIPCPGHKNLYQYIYDAGSRVGHQKGYAAAQQAIRGKLGL